MPTLEPDYKQALSLTIEAGGRLTREQLEWLSAFYDNVGSRMLNLYEAARLGAWRIYDRKELIDYWQDQADWFGQQYRSIRGLEDYFRKEAIPVPAAFAQAVETLTDIVDLCHGHYEVYA